MERKLAIVGLGLLGGSVAAALAQRAKNIGPWHVTGVAREEGVVQEALSMGIVCEGTTELGRGVAGADVVLFATPVRAIPPLVAEAAPFLKRGAVVTDVGSTKADLARSIPPLLPPGVHYVGGHPMAGSERTGFAAADPFLFENAMYVVTPSRPDAPGVSSVLSLVDDLGAQALLMEPEQHDRMVAAVSHLPHMVAAALVGAVGDVAREDARVLALAAGGFRDTTRVASGDPGMWRDIFLTNQTHVVNMIDRFIATLTDLRDATAAADEAGLTAFLARAQKIRDALPRHRQGILRPMCEIVVQLADRPGAISEVTHCIAQRNVNIHDIEVLRVREGEAGTLRLAFGDEADQAAALAALTARGFVARKRG